MCIDKLEQQQAELQLLILDVQAASNNETKSTAGDKHDTARAQAQIEVERLSKQLGLIYQMREELLKLPTENSSIIKYGSFVTTTAGNFYIAVALGKMHFDELECFVISRNSPLGKALVNKRIGDELQMMNGNKFTIRSFN